VKRLKKPTTVVLLVAMVTVAGCGQPPKKRQFNHKVAEANERLSNKARNFYKVIQPIGTGVAVQGSQAQSALTEIETALRDIRKEFDKMPPPLGSPKGAVMLQKYQAFLSTQQSIVDSCLKPIVAIIENASIADKWNRITPLLRKADDLERDSYNTLSASQREFAEAHKLKLQ
jgi:hypothetical protein